ncbi:hypothetical protein MCA2874 [Methylococcus capsulatus str. Bath]|uniref:Uncharacterized protein n=1 Tax=Methylococcus capsulatus (strain ATCC 33009 / NCIMB 11132 / Bath) TaxID=243233 RepID=Q603D3_METCA|nr:hypothetical protein MCA2874 [Methylococcus capsulatus str. Bath]
MGREFRGNRYHPINPTAGQRVVNIFSHASAMLDGVVVFPQNNRR